MNQDCEIPRLKWDARKIDWAGMLGFPHDQSPGNALDQPSNSKSSSTNNTFPLWSSCSSMSGHFTPLRNSSISPPVQDNDKYRGKLLFHLQSLSITTIIANHYEVINYDYRYPIRSGRPKNPTASVLSIASLYLNRPTRRTKRKETQYYTIINISTNLPRRTKSCKWPEIKC